MAELDTETVAGKLLVVDDLRTNLDIMSRILERQGYEVLLAKDGQEALRISADECPDLILLDVSMPGMNGFEVCQHLKENEATQHIPVMFISALNELGDKVRAFEAGAVDYIIKPFNADEVVARVHSQMMLAQQRQQIMALGDLKDQIVNTVSHDLKNPLQIVMGYSAMMMEGKDMSVEDMMDMSAQVYQSAQRMYHMVTNLLDLNHLEDGVRLELQQLVLQDMVDYILHDFTISAKQKDVTLEKDFPSEPITVDADSVRLEQVFNNLVSNAIKYTPAGGSVRVGVDVQGDHAVVQIEDDGLGIPDEALPDLFQRFYRVESTAHKEQEGSGLGLSIVKAIVERHGGEIWVDSTIGVGSVFSFSIPLA